MPPQTRSKAKSGPTPPPESDESAEPRTAGTQPVGSSPVPIPGGADTATSVEQIQVRRRQPALPAVRYDGSNAVQVGAWVLGQGRATCRVDFVPGKLPVLLRDDDTRVEPGWILPNLEVVTEQDLTTVYEQVPAS